MRDRIAVAAALLFVLSSAGVAHAGAVMNLDDIAAKRAEVPEGEVEFFFCHPHRRSRASARAREGSVADQHRIPGD